MKLSLILVPLFAGAAVLSCAYVKYEHYLLETRANSGDADAQYQLGKRFCSSEVESRDYAQGVFWMRKAAAQGDVRAETSLGLLYARGLGVGRSYSEAAKWLRKGAERGFPLAQNQLGVMYAQGKGVTRDLDQAMIWFSKAASRGLDVAKKNHEIASVVKRGFIDKVETRNGKTYRRLRVQKVEFDGITVVFQPGKGGFGCAKLKFKDLPEDLQHQYGYTAELSAAQMAWVIAQPL
jgi:hypothetical protein